MAKTRKKLVMPQSGADLISMLTESYGITSGAGLVLVQLAGQSLDQALEAEALLKADGMIVEGTRGKRAHPAANIARDARSRLLACLGKLNLEL